MLLLFSFSYSDIYLSCITLQRNYFPSTKKLHQNIHGLLFFVASGKVSNVENPLCLSDGVFQLVTVGFIIT